jgi:hypothetical protein
MCKKNGKNNRETCYNFWYDTYKCKQWEYKILPSLADEALAGWIWTDKKGFGYRKFIIIKNPENEGKSIITFKRRIDENFIKKYNGRREGSISKDDCKICGDKNTNHLVINEFYREELGISKTYKKGETGKMTKLEITNANWFNVLKYQWSHPNPAIQCGNRVAIASAAIGIIALLVSIFTLIQPLFSKCCG